jgi:DNA invertase Pin-like site-specific DNA recombinase
VRVAVYTRISTDEDRQPFSLEAQDKRLRSYIASHDNWHLVGEPYADQAIDRYLLAFENGTMPETLCAPRIEALGAKAADLRSREADLTDLLAQVRRHIRDVITQETPETTKALLAALIEGITIESRTTISPTFRVPLPNENGTSHEPEEAVRDMCRSVGVLGHYSRWTYWSNRIAPLLTVKEMRPPETLGDRKVLRKLSPEQVAELSRQYEAGATTLQLAESFGIHRTTVSAHLHRLGVKLRVHSMTTAEVDRAVALYEQGWSAARIGNELRYNDGTVRTALLGRGVKLRACYAHLLRHPDDPRSGGD